MQLIVNNYSWGRDPRGAFQPEAYPFYLADGVTVATDLSAACATKWIPTRGAKRGALGIGCTATGSPAGGVTLQVCNHGRNASSGATYCKNAVDPTVLFQPAGSAAATIVDGLASESDYYRVVYTPTSGGTGAVFTDDSGETGTSPVLTLKE